MMTLHSSKGLEFPVVFLVGMEEGLFPSIRNWEETPIEDIEEERRLCYVGMTRAKERLYLLSASMRRVWGNVTFNEPSRFLEEMPRNLLEFHALDQRGGPGRGISQRAVTPGARGHFDVAQESPMDESPSGDLVGRRLRHAEYGPGKIVAVDGSGSDQKVTIEFKSGPTRKFLFRYVASYLE